MGTYEVLLESSCLIVTSTNLYAVKVNSYASGYGEVSEFTSENAATTTMGLYCTNKDLKCVQKGGLGGTNHKIYAILDSKGLMYSHYANFAVIELMTRAALQDIVMVEHFVEKIYVINANYAVDTLHNMFRPILGRLSEGVEIYGPKKSKWLPILKRAFPLDALPPWYGGYGNFTPIAAYG